MHCLLNLLHDSTDHAWALRKWPLKIIHPKHPFTLHSNIPWPAACLFPEEAKVCGSVPRVIFLLLTYLCFLMVLNSATSWSLHSWHWPSQPQPFLPCLWAANQSEHPPIQHGQHLCQEIIPDPLQKSGFFCPTVLPAQQILDQAANLTKCRVWVTLLPLVREGLIYFVFLARWSVANAYHDVPCVGLPSAPGHHTVYSRIPCIWTAPLCTEHNCLHISPSSF